MNRKENTKIGKQCVKRVAKMLEPYGKVEVRKGEWFEPDILLTTPSMKAFAIDAKRLKAQINSKNANSVSINIESWKHYLAFSRKHVNTTPLIIVEIFIPNRKNLYFVLAERVVSEKMIHSNGEEWFGFSIWQVIDKGIRLERFFTYHKLLPIGMITSEI